MAKQSDRTDRDEENVSMKGSAQEKSGGNGGRQKMDAIEMLKADHRKVEQLFEKYQSARRRAEKSKIAQEICRELTVHAELEEEIFYPACREHVDDPMLDEAQVEHDGAKVLIYDIAIGTPTDPFYDAKVTVLSEYIRHHVQEEEKSAESIFAKAIEAGVDTMSLGQRMLKRREELMEENAESLFLPEPTTLHVSMEDFEGGASRQSGRGGASRGGEGRGGEGRGGMGGRRETEAQGGGRWEGGEGRGWSEGQDYDERRGWEERQGRDDERRSAQRGGQESGQGRGQAGRGAQEQRGWHGDPKRHSEASRRGWEHRR